MKAITTTSAIALTALLLTVGMFACWKTASNHEYVAPAIGNDMKHDELPDDIKSEFNSIEERISRHPERFAFCAIREMASSIADGGQRKSVARACARRFVSLRLKNDTVESMRDMVDHYVEYIYSIDDILCDAKVDDEERIDFFFAALALYRDYSCKGIPNEKQIEDFYEWNEWACSVYVDRGRMLYHLQKAMRLIYNKGLHNINTRHNGEVLRRFVDFYIGAVAMVKEKDEYQKKHIRPRPKDRLCWSLNVMYRRERSDYEIPSVISFGTNKIDICKWESGEKEKIIADILEKDKKTKGTTPLRTGDVEIKVDGID